MDFQQYVDCCSAPCAVLSVVRTEDGFCGPIHIVCSNQPYKDIMGPAYYDNMPYEELVPKDPKFEDFCFRAAHMNQRMHAYVQTKALNCWTDQVMIPLQPQTEPVGYCQFLFEFTESADPARMASVSMDTAAAAIKAGITLLSADDFKESVRDVLSDILEMSEAFACRIMLIDHEKREACTFCEKVQGDLPPVSAMGDGTIPYEIVASWEDMIGVSNAVIVKNEQDMASVEARNPAWVQSMRQYDVTSLVLIPLRRGKAVVGYLYVVNFNVEKVVEVKELVELMSVFLGSEIANHLLMGKLEELSTVDSLTGLFNRNAMLQRMADIDEAEPGTSFGVVNVDLNGLKAANDEGGHEEGDKLLIKAADTLGGVFRKSDLFRIGGDEFVALVTGISRDLFEQKVEQLRVISGDDADVCFAIGAFWSDGSTDVHAAYRYADSDMYTNKRAYYARAGER